MSISPDRVNCAICEWAGDYSAISHNDTEAPASALYWHHFASESHINNYEVWCVYREEQNIPQDYVADWLGQTRLADIHDSALVHSS